MLNSAQYTGLAPILKQQWPVVTPAIVVEARDKLEIGHDFSKTHSIDYCRHRLQFFFFVAI